MKIIIKLAGLKSFLNLIRRNDFSFRKKMTCRVLALVIAHVWLWLNT